MPGSPFPNPTQASVKRPEPKLAEQRPLMGRQAGVAAVDYRHYVTRRFRSQPSSSAPILTIVVLGSLKDWLASSAEAAPPGKNGEPRSDARKSRGGNITGPAGASPGENTPEYHFIPTSIWSPTVEAAVAERTIPERPVRR